MSYANLILYNAVIPSYESYQDKKNKKDKGEVVNADDRKNKDLVHRIMFGE